MPNGVEIRYEEEDAEQMLHLMYFLDTHVTLTNGAPVFVPTIVVNGNKSSAVKVMKEFEKFVEGKRSINGTISVFFKDELRPLFDGYIASLDVAKTSAEETFEWDEDHQFFFLHFFFYEVKRTYFPNIISMH